MCSTQKYCNQREKCAILANTQFRSPASSSSSSSSSPSQHILLYFVRIYFFQHFSLKFISIWILSHSQLDRMHLFLNDFFLLVLDVSVMDFDVYAYLSPTKKFMFRFWLWFRFEFGTKTAQKYVVCHGFEFDAGVERHKVMA